MKNTQILLIEDNQDDQELTLLALEKNGLANEIVVARDGAEALDYLYCQGEHAGRDPNDLPALILLDLKLPKISGLEVLSRLRQHEQTRLIPVVVLTSSSEEKDILKSYLKGANSCVRKPVEFEQFVKAVSEVGLYWLALSERVPREEKI